MILVPCYAGLATDSKTGLEGVVLTRIAPFYLVVSFIYLILKVT